MENTQILTLADVSFFEMSLILFPSICLSNDTHTYKHTAHNVSFKLTCMWQPPCIKSFSVYFLPVHFHMGAEIRFQLSVS